MSQRSLNPDFSGLEIAVDAWSEPFWQAGAQGRLVMPRCVSCATFRWPAGPFCPRCRAQEVDWVSPGQGRVYSFTILPVPAGEGAEPGRRIPALVEFDEAPGVRLVSVLVDAPVEEVAIDRPVTVEWQSAANGVVPVFRLIA